MLGERRISQAELDRDFVEPARREAAVEMPQPRDDHPHDRHRDIGPRLIEDQEIEALALRKRNASDDLLARVEPAKARA